MSAGAGEPDNGEGELESSENADMAGETRSSSGFEYGCRCLSESADPSTDSSEATEDRNMSSGRKMDVRI